MKHLVEYPLEDGGGTVVVEVDDNSELSGSVNASRDTGTLLIKANQTFDNALGIIKPSADAIIKNLRGLVNAPDEIKVEFGIKLAAETGAVIAASSIEANFKIVLKWTKP